MIVNTSSEIQTSTGYVITDNKSGEVIFRFDTIEEFNFSATATVTSYPTEKGINVNDYKYLNADNFSARGLISRRSSNANQIELIQSQLKFYQSGMYGLNIQTKSGLYERYTLADYEIVENADNYGLFEVDMNFKQMLNVDGAQYNRASYDNDTVDAGISYVQEISAESTEYNYIRTGIYFDPSLIAGIIQAAEVSGDGASTIDTGESGSSGGESGGGSSGGESGSGSSGGDESSTGLRELEQEGKTITKYELSYPSLGSSSISPTKPRIYVTATYDDGSTKSVYDRLKLPSDIRYFPWEHTDSYMINTTSNTAEINLAGSKIKASGNWSWVEETYEITSQVTFSDETTETNRVIVIYANDIAYYVDGVSYNFGHYNITVIQRGGSATYKRNEKKDGYEYNYYNYIDVISVNDAQDNKVRYYGNVRPTGIIITKRKDLFGG